IAVVNKTLYTKQRFSCVSRCRRFGKSMAAEMLCAYYDQSCDSRHLFEDLEIAKDPSFEQHLNKYPVLYLDLSDFVTRFKDESIISKMDHELMEDIHTDYSDLPIENGDDLMKYLGRIAMAKKQQFIFIIDEWDAICREFEPETTVFDAYLDWLRRMFKGGQTMQVFAGVYMTGILPIKKYKMQSAMNNFREYSMVSPRNMSHFFGFTKDEVKMLAERHGMDFDELEKWYDGYQIGDEQSIFNPNSVMSAVECDYCESYWAATGSYDTVADYIKMNYEGLKDDIISMLAGERCSVDPTMFNNDMSVIHSKDDVLTVLIHLGYLSYDRRQGECYIPNKEVAGEMVNAVKSNNWKHVAEALDKSRRLLQATLSGDSEAVARGVEIAHDENTSVLSYNDENSLACVLSIAYYYAKNNYIVHRELATGKGFADLVLVPRKNVESPALVIELKVDKTADAAIDQIRRRQYPEKILQYTGNLLLVGINYNRDTKQHTCCIERL
ncbi:MAG: AAA family ATPase, partial [Prevotella sp.]|nr:AAA family ATPase [Prevotella sp.]